MNKREIGSEADIFFEDDFTAVRGGGEGGNQGGRVGEVEG
jgi:hypothetical protein